MKGLGTQKLFAFLLALTTVTAVIIPCLPRVSAVNVTKSIYQGQIPPLQGEFPSYFTFILANEASINPYNGETFWLKANQNLILNLNAVAGESGNGRGVGLLQVSYNASWLSQHPIVIFKWNGNPGDLDEWFRGGPPSTFNHKLVWSDIPEGNQYIEFTIVKIALYLAPTSNAIYFSTSTLESSVDLNFTVAPLVISHISPENKTYYTNQIPLNFNVNENPSWLGYSIDNLANVTLTGNTTLKGLTNGYHSFVVYFNDSFGNLGKSETINFTVEPFPIIPVTVPVAIAVVAALFLVLYRRHRKTANLSK